MTYSWFYFYLMVLYVSYIQLNLCDRTVCKENNKNLALLECYTTIIQIVSIICPSRMNRLVCLFWMIRVIVYNTVVITINIIIRAWSWQMASRSGRAV